jgi:hypothetical protein
MPTFITRQGKPLWFPAQGIMRMEPGEGGLTTIIHAVPPPGAPPGSTLSAEVDGTVFTHGIELDRLLRGTPS